MPEIVKSKSPFYPGQPVPVELFVGRSSQINHIMQRGVGQVANGKPVALYIQGEYGIGKSSIAGFLQWLAERDHNLHAVYAPLGGARTLDEVGAAILEATIRSGALNPKRSETLRNWLAKYIGEQSLFGITIHAEALTHDAPGVAKGILPFLGEVYVRLKDTGVKGLFLVLDEINGITADPQFAHFIKGIVDTNAMSREPLPLLLTLSGVEERRREMIQNYQPIDRIFDVVEIAPMNDAEMKEFFTRAFDSVQMRVDPPAMEFLVHYSAGFPKIMHLVGDAAYWIDRDGEVDEEDATSAVIAAADEVGKKYVDQQVYKALHSKDYLSILDKLGQLNFDSDSMSFMKADLVAGLTETEKKKVNNFLQKMKALKVLRSGDVAGEYVFNVRMVRLYIWLQGLQRQNHKP
jgi:hypothetical protein